MSERFARHFKCEETHAPKKAAVACLIWLTRDGRRKCAGVSACIEARVRSGCALTSKQPPQNIIHRIAQRRSPRPAGDCSRTRHDGHRPRMTEAFCPPKPNELLKTTFTLAA